MAQVDVFDDADALLDAAAAAVADTAARSISARGRVTIALSGGSTPRGLYQRLAGRWRDRVNWARVHVFWGDERCVPPTHAESNYRMAREALLDHVPIPPAHVHRMIGEAEPTDAAEDYAATLAATLGRQVDGRPGALDLVLLGLGADGHTASLFPGGTAGAERRRWAVAECIDAARGWRITLTPVALNAARSMLWLVSGADKAPALAAVLEGPPDPDRVPAQRVTGSGAHWMVDRAAARLLNAGTG